MSCDLAPCRQFSFQDSVSFGFVLTLCPVVMLEPMAGDCGRHNGPMPCRLLFWGSGSIVMPRPVPVAFVSGRPIQVPHRPDPEGPSDAEVQKYAEVFYEELAAVAASHAAHCEEHRHLQLQLVANKSHAAISTPLPLPTRLDSQAVATASRSNE